MRKMGSLVMLLLTFTLSVQAITYDSVVVIPSYDSTGYTLPKGGSLLVSLAGIAQGDSAMVALSGDMISSVTCTNPALSILQDPDNARFFISSGSALTLCTLTVTLQATTTDSLASSVMNPLTIPLTVTAASLDSVQVLKLDTLLVDNTMTTQFTFAAYDSQGVPVTVTPSWSIAPTTAGTISAQGVLSPQADFIGRVDVVGSVDATQSDIYDSSGTSGLFIGAPITPSTNTIFTDRRGAQVRVKTGALLAGEQSILRLTIPTPENKLYKVAIEKGVTLISDIYRLSIDDSAVLATDSSDYIELTIPIPSQYHRYLSGTMRDTSLCKIALFHDGYWYWDYAGISWDWDSTLQTTIPDSLRIPPTRYDPLAKTLTVSVSRELDSLATRAYSIALMSSDLEGSLTIRPNPFSPFVSPLNDYLHIANMGPQIKGTCFKITPPNRETAYDQTAMVSIYTPAGELVWRTRLGSVLPGKAYYVFWDGRTLIHRNSADQFEQIQENSAISIEGENLCRNGRYIVNVTFDGGSSGKKRITQEVILFK